MKRIKSLSTVVLALLLALTLSSGCGGGKTETAAPKARELTKIRYSEVVHSIFYAPKYVAINKGFFKEEGLDIDLTTAQGADKVMTALLSNAADIGLAGPEATVYVFNQGQQDYVINFAPRPSSPSSRTPTWSS